VIKPRLSICIATYNRADYIGETLESIIPQVTDEVEIVIVDGASTDGTESIIRKYSETCRQIRYIRLPSKGGVDHDYNQAVEYAQGEYCWLFTDDDVLVNGAVGQVLQELSRGYSLIVVEAEVWNRDFSAQISDKHFSDSVRPVYEPHEFDDFFHDCIKYLSFIGGVVIKRDLWRERDREPYYGTEFIHIGVIFQKVPPAAVRVVTSPLIKIRYGNAQWSGRKFTVWMIRWPKLLWSFDSISRNTKENFIAEEPWRNLNSLFVSRSLSAYDTTNYQELISQHHTSFSWRFFAGCIAIFPIPLAKAITVRYFILRGKTKSVIYSDLAD
jgi:abequosyltransferase